MSLKMDKNKRRRDVRLIFY